MTRRVLGAVLLLVCVVAGVAAAHELAEPSITLTVREGGFVGVRVQLPWSAVLRARFFPAMNATQALGTLASLPPASFAAKLLDAQRDIERTLLVRANGAPPRGLARYVWPSAGDVQQALRTEMMERMATPDGSGHAVRFPVSAELQLSSTVRSVQVQPPAVFGATMITLQRPVERMVRGGAMSSPIAIPVPPT
jgi:hypothetical protein